MSWMTDEELREHASVVAEVCPVCCSEKVELGQLDFIATGEARQPNQCKVCSAMWEVVYRPTGLIQQGFALNDKQLGKSRMQAKYDGLDPDEGWGEHPDYPMVQWQELVHAGDCRSGYWEWVQSQLEQEYES